MPPETKTEKRPPMKIKLRRLEVGETANPDTDISCNTNHVIYRAAKAFIREGTRPHYRIELTPWDTPADPAPEAEKPAATATGGEVDGETKEFHGESLLAKGWRFRWAIVKPSGPDNWPDDQAELSELRKANETLRERVAELEKELEGIKEVCRGN